MFTFPQVSIVQASCIMPWRLRRNILGVMAYSCPLRTQKDPLQHEAAWAIYEGLGLHSQKTSSDHSKWFTDHGEDGLQEEREHHGQDDGDAEKKEPVGKTPEQRKASAFGALSGDGGNSHTM